jgi:hypothetical protein
VKPTPHGHSCIGTPPVPVQDICDQSQKTCAGERAEAVLVCGVEESGRTSLVWTSREEGWGFCAGFDDRKYVPVGAAAAHARFRYLKIDGDIAAGVQVEWSYGNGARLLRNLTDRQLELLRPKVKKKVGDLKIDGARGSRRRVFTFGRATTRRAHWQG